MMNLTNFSNNDISSNFQENRTFSRHWTFQGPIKFSICHYLNYMTSPMVKKMSKANSTIVYQSNLDISKHM